MSKRRFFVYATDLLSFAAVNETKLVTVPIENTMDFVWVTGSYSSDVAAVMAGTDTVHGGVLLNRLSDGGAQDSLAKKPVPLSHFFGRPGVARDNRDLPWIMRFASNGNILMELVNLVAGAHNVRVSFSGFLVPQGEAI